MFYNTTNEKGEDLKEYKEKAESQEDFIFDIIKRTESRVPNFKFSSSDLLGLDRFKNTPLTSIRRAVTNLVKDDKLEYTGEKVTGTYGRPENLIKLK